MTLVWFFTTLYYLVVQFPSLIISRERRLTDVEFQRLFEIKSFVAVRLLNTQTVGSLATVFGIYNKLAVATVVHDNKVRNKAIFNICVLSVRTKKVNAWEPWELRKVHVFANTL